MTDKKNNCIDKVVQLFNKYENNEYMLNRIYTHIINYLPNSLENEHKNYDTRIKRNSYLSSKQQIFIQVFLSKNKYFYLSNNCGFFYEYNNTNYHIIKEDDIIHKLLSSISKERVLLEWKHKTKINIIKQIKERSLFDSIPETETIQNILNALYPSIFCSKNYAKYFLVIIGDNIFKKNSQLIFLVNQKMKKLLNVLDNIAYVSIGNSNITHNFMTKYHENHQYNNCRLIKINENCFNDMWQVILKKIGLDLLCVAAHYSKQYENSDKFIENKCDDELTNYVYYLKNTKQIDIINNFCIKSIKVDDENTGVKIEWKNLHFIWKLYLHNFNLPNMIYSNTLKTILKSKYNYDETTDSFINITSKYLPIQSDFIHFWENTINIYTEQTFINELEIDELCSLFKMWSKSSDNLLTNGNISEENVIKILKHFFPNVEIIEDKYLLNISCSLWDKLKDIQRSFHYIKQQIKENNLTTMLISFDDAYNYYYKFCNIKSYKFIVSKRYFEKYLTHKLTDYIVYEKFIKIEYILKYEFL
jgi:hypothetical protein